MRPLVSQYFRKTGRHSEDYIDDGKETSRDVLKVTAETEVATKCQKQANLRVLTTTLPGLDNPGNVVVSTSPTRRRSCGGEQNSVQVSNANISADI